ncbi:MAG TPA: DUF1080 domain-containing protein [Verrucomicrobiae bacterium]|jgi:hypothetical protein|nr:DUF1080 domain-containing protein [Verrucomicrobiae bacterium]
MKIRIFAVWVAVVAVVFAGRLAAEDDGFVSLFDGQTLNGWREMHKTAGPPYFVTNGVIASPPNAANDLVTEQTFGDFIFRMDFKLTPGANNGVGIRVPMETNDLTYSGNEVQILDDDDPQYAHLDPGQYCGSLYKIFAAKRGALKKVGEWNHYEISFIGRHITVALNGATIVDGNVNTVTSPAVLRGHPGMLRDRGHIALLGHWSYVEFRNIYIKELPVSETDNTPPEGFTALFDGNDLNGWKGLVADPPARAKMSSEELAAAQGPADRRMRDHWKVEGGTLVFDGKGDNLCTARDYGDFEMLVDWKIAPRGDSGIYLRGTPQVQIWETNSPGQFDPPEGSGELWNNHKNNRHPMVYADHPVGEWNRFRILMVGEKVHVFLNGQLVVRDTTLENYWEPDKPIYPIGQIELQNHGGPLWFKNIYIREIPRKTE